MSTQAYPKTITPEMRREALEAWDAAVAIGLARRRALMDASVDVEQYCSLSRAEMLANHIAVQALGGYCTVTIPALTAWGDAR